MKISNKKWEHVWFLVKHIIWFVKHYKDKDKYIFFCSTLKYHDKEMKRLKKMKHRE